MLDQQYRLDSANRQAVQSELEGIRQAGFAATMGEVDAGVWGVSVPLFDTLRQAVGAITLMAPFSRAQNQDQALIRMTIVTAARISRGLGIH